jgi:hypothetical protein
MAAYNNGFPASYQPMYYQPQYQQVQPYVQAQQPAQQNNGIIWVQGEAGAKSYLVAPNTTVQLWDSESQCIYLKSADASGMPSMKILDYTIRDMTPANGPVAASPAPTINAQDYALRTDLDTLAAQITALKAEIEKKGASVNE